MIPVKAYIQLLKIASIEGTDRNSGVKAREEALKLWLKDWVEEVSNSQSAMTNLVSSENQDTIMYYLAGHLTEELMEECVTIEKQPTKITTRIAAFRRRGKSENSSES